MSYNGLMPSIWGPGLWKGMHSISYGYPENPTDGQKKNFHEFFVSIKNVLPCKYCRESYDDFISDKNSKSYFSPDDYKENVCLENRESLTTWLYNLHNQVNKKLCVDYLVTKKDVDDRYETFRAKCNPKSKTCDMPEDQKLKSFTVDEKNNFRIIDYEIARKFWGLTEKRMEDEKNDDVKIICKDDFKILEQIKNDPLIMSNIYKLKEKDIWGVRNDEIKDIIKKIKTGDDVSKKGRVIDFDDDNVEVITEPSNYELKLIMRLCTTFNTNDLINISKYVCCKYPWKISQNGGNLKKKYSLIYI